MTVIPTGTDQNPCVQSRIPMDMILHGWSASLASRLGQTEQALHNRLAEPHPPMPDLGLAATEFDDLAAYIMSLNR